MDIGRPPSTHHIRANLWVVGELAQFLVGHEESVIAGNEDVVWVVRRPVCGSHESVQELWRRRNKRARGCGSADSRHGRSGRVRGRSGQRRGPLLGDERIWSAGSPSQLVHDVLWSMAGYCDTAFVRGGSCGSGTSCGYGGRSIGSCGGGRNVWKPKRSCWNWKSGGGDPSASGAAGSATDVALCDYGGGRTAGVATGGSGAESGSGSTDSGKKCFSSSFYRTA